MAVLMPITSPRMLSSGPPLLPGLMAASVCRKCWNWEVSPGISRSLALMMPAVTVAWNPKGDPMAMHQSPTWTASELPILAGTTLLLPSTRMTARSVGASTPTTLASYSVGSSVNFTWMRSALSTTWLLVRM